MKGGLRTSLIPFAFESRLIHPCDTYSLRFDGVSSVAEPHNHPVAESGTLSETSLRSINHPIFI
jgi:hypothetical protein